MKLLHLTEIFYSIQGEGYHAGTPAVFVRFSGCNLDCSFCDTDFSPRLRMTEEEIVAEVAQYPCRLVVLTGGEPCLQITESFVETLHKVGKYVAVETNGTQIPPQNIDWITVSPKQQFVARGEVRLRRANELKLVNTSHNTIETFGIEAEHLFLQPCDTGNPKENKVILDHTINYIKQHPEWRISIQLHKVLDVQ